MYCSCKILNNCACHSVLKNIFSLFSKLYFNVFNFAFCKFYVVWYFSLNVVVGNLLPLAFYKFIKSYFKNAFKTDYIGILYKL